MTHAPKVVWHPSAITSDQRAELAGHRGAVVWFTGLSGSGKSTIANAVDGLLHARGLRSFLIDGDNVRHGLCATPSMLASSYGESFAKRFGLGFIPEDREENIRRVGAVAQLFASAGVMCLTALVSPYRRDRERVRAWVENQDPGNFLEIYINTPLEVCMQRDPKGLYRQAIAGEIAHFTGISDPYEAPEKPDLELDGSSAPVEELAQRVLQLFIDRGLLPAAANHDGNHRHAQPQ